MFKESGNSVFRIVEIIIENPRELALAQLISHLKFGQLFFISESRIMKHDSQIDIYGPEILFPKYYFSLKRIFPHTEKSLLV